MEVTQVYSLVNQATQEALGQTAVLNEDLSNVVDIGEQIFNANAVDRYVKALVNHIGKVVFVNRVYRGSAPSVLMDGWEFGSVLEKVRMELPEATENESWELEDGTSYDPNIFTAPKVSVKFFNKKVTFEVPMSFTEMQVKQSFSNEVQLNAFVSMIYVGVENAMTIKLDSLIMRTINVAIGETLSNAYPDSDYGTSSKVNAVNLLYLYNQNYSKSLTSAQALADPDFIRFASFIMNLYVSRLGRYSTLFNAGATEKFTPRDMLKIVMLADFESAARVYLYDANGQLKDENLRLPSAETVPYWQGSGTDYDFDSVSSINIKTPSNNTVSASGILCVMFDRDALGVANMNRRVTSNYNAKAEFYNNWYKMDAQYFFDPNENCVVFFVADSE